MKFLWVKNGGVEIDFVCFKNDKVKYVQVKYEIPRRIDCDTNHLLQLRDNYEKLVVSTYYLDVGVIDGIDGVHLRGFLLKER